jgi:hypothetical protein
MNEPSVTAQGIRIVRVQTEFPDLISAIVNENEGMPSAGTAVSLFRQTVPLGYGNEQQRWFIATTQPAELSPGDF